MESIYQDFAILLCGTMEKNHVHHPEGFGQQVSEAQTCRMHCRKVNREIRRINLPRLLMLALLGRTIGLEMKTKGVRRGSRPKDTNVAMATRAPTAVGKMFLFVRCFNRQDQRYSALTPHPSDLVVILGQLLWLPCCNE